MALNEKAFDIALTLSDKHREFDDIRDHQNSKSSHALQPSAAKVRREIETLEKMLKDLDRQRAEVEWELGLSQKKAKKLEEVSSYVSSPSGLEQALSILVTAT